MKIIEARNVHDALPKALALLDQHGIERNSRNGPVLVAPWPVCTVYSHPWERVIFWPERDANPFFHLYESLWMLAGRNDVKGVATFAKRMLEFSDDGETLHGAYGARWLDHFAEYIPAHKEYEPMNQLVHIANALRENPEDRRCVLQMWDAGRDLSRGGKDVPCNLTATFQRNANGTLELTVFCRSNDILWGAYGANAVHFSMLHEYMAAKIGCPMGVYRQISVNWHAYVETLKQVRDLPRYQGMSVTPYNTHSHPSFLADVFYLPIPRIQFDRLNESFLSHTDAGSGGFKSSDPFFDTANRLFRAHYYWRTLAAPERFDRALETLAKGNPRIDWIRAATEWIERRQAQWERRMKAEDDGVMYEG